MSVPRRRLLPSLVDQRARSEPDKAWASIQNSDNSDFTDISFSTFANAINRVAHWILNTVGQPALDGMSKKPVLAYIGDSDLRYYVVPLAMVKVGYVPLFISHLNSVAANSHLFQASGCKTIIFGFSGLESVNVAADEMNIIHALSPDAVWDPTPVPVLPFTTDFDEVCNEPLLMLHTSGSTGMPKPITYTHAWMACGDAAQDIKAWQNHEPELGLYSVISRSFWGFPPFHAAGFAAGLRDSVFYDTTIALPAPNRILDIKAFVEILGSTAFDSVALLPHQVEDIARSPEALKLIEKLKFVIWAGGPISQQAGDRISTHTQLINAYASTESGHAHTLIKPNPRLWQYYFFHPETNGFQFRAVPGQEDVFELFIVKDPKCLQSVFTIFPDLNEWPTKDLFRAHPSLPHHWIHDGRADNLVVFANGTKLNPRAIEANVKSAPGVRDAIVFGTGRATPGILVECVTLTASAEVTGYLDGIWSSVEATNARMPTNGVIMRDLLLLANPNKPLPRTSKQTLQRAAALQLYKKEIDALYDALPHELLRGKDYRIGATDKASDPPSTVPERRAGD